MFHKFSEISGPFSDNFCISISDFHRFLDHVSSEYTILDISLVNSSKGKNCFLTFDDVDESVYTLAYPVLKAYSVPFTIFVNISLLDSPGYITLSQLKELSNDQLCTVGSHGSSHVFYRSLNGSLVHDEFLYSRVFLECHLNRCVDYFAFPFGNFYSCSIREYLLARKSGYQFCFWTFDSGLLPFFISHFIPRKNVDVRYIDAHVK